MPSPSVTVRLNEETYQMLIGLAKAENKTVAQLTRELIEHGLGRHITAEDALMNEMRTMNIQLGDILARALKAAAGSQYFARLATSYAMDITQYVTSEQPMNEGSKQQLMTQYDQKAREFENHYMKDSWEKL